MLAPAWDLVRLSLHVLGAAVWVGGQITLAGLVPAVRPAGPDALTAVARRFAELAWPAFAVLVATGVWNVLAMDPSKQTSAWRVVLSVKIAAVVVAGAATWLHQRASTRRAVAAFGALSALSAMAALVLGVALAG
jgi:putative copper export protein